MALQVRVREWKRKYEHKKSLRSQNHTLVFIVIESISYFGAQIASFPLNSQFMHDATAFLKWESPMFQ